MKKILSILAFVFPILVIGQTQSENYIKTTEYQKKEQNENAAIPNDKKIESITYFDGLGRPKQNISVRAGGQSQDIITPIVYDEFGRQALDYLPYASSSSIGAYRNNAINQSGNYTGSPHYNFYNTPKYENTTNPYSESDLENSPLSRVLKQGAPGEDWKLGNGHEIEFKHHINTANEVRLFKVGGTSQSPTLSQNSNWYYPANELYKTITKDENHAGTTKNHTTEEFKDKQGRVVLKRTYNAEVTHDTYYVYDDFGNLTYVIPPKVTTSNVSTTELNELCYQYKYDDRNRLIEKKIPGKGWEFIIYNKLDQPILTQDANLRGTGTSREWLFTKYDAFGRVAYTGLYTYTDSNTDSWQRLSDLQDDVNSETIQFEGRSNSTVDGEVINWSNAAFPHTSITELHTVNYYDNYAFNTSNLGIPTGSIYGQTIATGNEIKGLATGSKVRVLGTNDWITTISVYDKKGQPIYIGNANNHLSTYDITQTEYDFTGKVLKIRNNHNRGGNPTIVTLDTFEYDHMGRLLNQIQCIGDGSLPDDCAGVGSVANLVLTSPVTTSKTEVASTSIIMDTGFIVDATVNSSLSFTASIESGGEQIVANHYDELGQLDYKNVGGKPSPSGGGATGGGGLQTVDYTYNIRGWLKEINDPNNLGTDLFAFGIKYNTPDYSPSTRGLFNGNISETHWITANDNKNRNYRYQYDALNRIVDAINIGENEGHRYRVINITYDKNGNLLGLDRNGWKNEAVSYGNIDVLEYTYDSGNKLTKVKDYGSGDYGFKDGTNTGNDYVYDANGNLTSDANKQITSILYNHLNLPTEVKFNNSNTRKINYIYGADGTKLQKLVNDNGNETTTDYASGYVYENDELQFFNTAEGYVTPDNNGGYDYVYQYKDHLGNIRLSYTTPENFKILANNHFNNGLEGWTSKSNVTINQDVNRIKVSVANKWKGIHKDIICTPGETLNIKAFIDEGNTERVTLGIYENDSSGNYLGIRNEFDDVNGEISGTVILGPQTTSFRVVIDKQEGSDHGVLTHYFVDEVRMTINDLIVVEENNYYPFGLRHKGYNNNVSANANSVAQKFKYNGVELEEGLGLNLYEMDFRQYDPAIARFTAIDPVTHFQQSTYTAFDNNPAYWTDPSGTQSVQDLINQARPGVKYTSNGDGTFSGNGHSIGEQNEPPQEGQAKVEHLHYGIDNVEKKTSFYHSTGDGEGEWLSENQYFEQFRSIIRAIGQGRASIEVLNNYGFTDEMLFAMATWASQASEYYGGVTPRFHDSEFRPEQNGAITPMYLESPFFGIGGLAKLFRGIGLKKSVSSVLGKKYSSVALRSVSITNQNVLMMLNKTEAGKWVKVYEAGYLGSKKIEVHYFLNKKTSKMFDVKIKRSGNWSRTNFGNRAGKNKITQ